MAKLKGLKASKRKAEDLEDGDAAAAERLAVFGERFMAMFDDAAEPDAPPTKSRQFGSKLEVGGSKVDASEPESSSGDEDRAGGAPADVVEELFRGGGGAAASAASAHRGGAVSSGSRSSARGAGPAGGAGGQPALAEQQRQEELARLRAERKRFMSPKAAVVGGGGGSQAPSQRRTPGRGGAAAAAEDGGLSRAEFLEMQREVQLYGASGLDKRSKKAFEAAQLAKIGAKAEAKPRIPAKIGFGMAKKQAQRADRALQEGIAAGMIKQKGIGKKKRREKAKGLDRGLMEDGGAFRPGILRVKPPPSLGGGGGSKRRK